MDPDPNTSWYIQKSTRKIEGPFLDNQILKLAKEGKISRSFKLKHAQRTDGKWVFATEVPGVGKLVLQNANGMGELPPEFEEESLGDGLPSWTAASQVPQAAIPGASDYWNQVTHGLAAANTKQTPKTGVPVEPTSNASSKQNTASKRQLNDLLIGGAILLMLLGILVSGGMILLGSFFLGEERELTDRGKANRRELREGIDRTVQAAAGSAEAPAPVLTRDEAVARTQSGGNEKRKVPSGSRSTQPSTMPPIDFSKLSGRYEIGDKVRAHEERTSIQLAKIGKTVEEKLNFDIKLFELFLPKGHVSAEVQVETLFQAAGKQIIICRIIRISNETPGREDYDTAWGKESFDKIKQIIGNGGQLLAISVSDNDLQNLSDAKITLQRELAKSNLVNLIDRNGLNQLVFQTGATRIWGN